MFTTARPCSVTFLHSSNVLHTPQQNFPHSAWHKALGTHIHHWISLHAVGRSCGAIWQSLLHVQVRHFVSSMTNSIISTWAFQGEKSSNYLVNTWFFKRKSMNLQRMKTGSRHRLNQKRAGLPTLMLFPTKLQWCRKWVVFFRQMGSHLRIVEVMGGGRKKIKRRN